MRNIKWQERINTFILKADFEKVCLNKYLTSYFNNLTRNVEATTYKISIPQTKLR